MYQVVQSRESATVEHSLHFVAMAVTAFSVPWFGLNFGCFYMFLPEL